MKSISYCRLICFCQFTVLGLIVILTEDFLSYHYESRHAMRVEHNCYIVDWRWIEFFLLSWIMVSLNADHHHVRLEFGKGFGVVACQYHHVRISCRVHQMALNISIKRWTLKNSSGCALVHVLLREYMPFSWSPEQLVSTLALGLSIYMLITGTYLLLVKFLFISQRKMLTRGIQW